MPECRIPRIVVTNRRIRDLCWTKHSTRRFSSTAFPHNVSLTLTAYYYNLPEVGTTQETTRQHHGQGRKRPWRMSARDVSLFSRVAQRTRHPTTTRPPVPAAQYPARTHVTPHEIRASGSIFPSSPLSVCGPRLAQASSRRSPRTTTQQLSWTPHAHHCHQPPSAPLTVGCYRSPAPRYH